MESNNNNNNNEKEKVMSYYPQTIASKMKKGLTNKINLFCEISRVLREDGKSRTEINYYMNVDEDFVTDVLNEYPRPEKRKSVSPKNNLNPWINHSRKIK